MRLETQNSNKKMQSANVFAPYTDILALRRTASPSSFGGKAFVALVRWEPTWVSTTAFSGDDAYAVKCIASLKRREAWYRGGGEGRHGCKRLGSSASLATTDDLLFVGARFPCVYARVCLSMLVYASLSHVPVSRACKCRERCRERRGQI